MPCRCETGPATEAGPSQEALLVLLVVLPGLGALVADRFPGVETKGGISSTPIPPTFTDTRDGCLTSSPP